MRVNKNVLWTVVKIALAASFGYIIFINLYLYFFQESFIFLEIKATEESVGSVREKFPEAEEVRIKTPDGVTLHGWFLKNSEVGKKSSPLLLYFGGNGEEVSWNLSDRELYKGWSMALINYRGYGLSQGSPGEKELFDDALLIYDHFSKREGIDKEKIVAMGRSLGTGVAVHLAVERPLKGLILVSPYDSIVSVAKGHFPYVAVSTLLRHPFDALSLAPSVKAPMLALAARDDTIIPPTHSERLVESWGGEHTFHVIPGTDHNEIALTEEYRKSIREFLAGL
ncbi:MAG: alpha/beta hydrolase [Thermodesulfobacteriota bacterium]